jgi:purine-binding chemotaxis protein CheW
MRSTGSVGSESKSQDTGSRGSGSGSSRGGVGLGVAVAVFSMNKQSYAMGIEIVGEVVTVEAIAPIPLPRPGLVGVFNLRGTPVALVDLSRVLGLAGATRAIADGDAPTALVLLHRNAILGAILIDRMDAVLPVDRGQFTPREGGHEHPAVKGFLEVEGRAGVITVFDTSVLLHDLSKLRY